MHVCMYVCMYVCMFACMYTMYVCMYVCMHVCMYVCMYASTDPKNLKLPCKGSSKSRMATLRRIQKGLLPSGLSCWPSERVAPRSAGSFIEL